MSNDNQKKNQNQERTHSPTTPPAIAPAPAPPQASKAAPPALVLDNGMTIKAQPRFTVQATGPGGTVDFERIVYADSVEDAQNKLRKVLNM